MCDTAPWTTPRLVNACHGKKQGAAAVVINSMYRHPVHVHTQLLRRVNDSSQRAHLGIFPAAFPVTTDEDDCPWGYEWSDESRSCVDVDECEEVRVCVWAPHMQFLCGSVHAA